MLIPRDDSLSTITKFLDALRHWLSSCASPFSSNEIEIGLTSLRHWLSSCASPFPSDEIELGLTSLVSSAWLPSLPHPPPPPPPPPCAPPVPPPLCAPLPPPALFGRIYQGKKLSFRNVGELKTAGIKFKPTDSLTAISFHTRFFITGQLRLPTLVVDDLTKRKLLNLVAYEMCLPPDDDEDCWVTSYINLLDLLIDSEQDVKDLRAVDLVRNCLSSDVEVAQLINNIGSLCFTPPEDSYEHVKDEIEKHCKRRFAIWMTQVWDTHFSSPWTIIALFVATTLLALTAIQTWYALHPKN